MRTLSIFSVALFCCVSVGCTIKQTESTTAGSGGAGAGQAGSSAAGSGGTGNAAGAGGQAGSAAGAGGEAGGGAAAGEGGSAGSKAGQGGSAGAGAGSGGAAGEAGGQAGSGVAGSGVAGSGTAGSGVAGGAGGEAGGAGGSPGGAGGEAGSGAGGEAGGEAGSGGAGGEAGGSAGAGGQPGGGLTSCSEAIYFSGDPANGDEPLGQNPAGHPFKGSPPLMFHDMAINGDLLGVANQSELWVADLKAAEPKYVRVTGNQDQFGYHMGSCEQTRLRVADGLAPLPGGEWLIADFVGNSIVRVSGVGTPGCKAEVIAGNAEEFDGVKTTPFKLGDADGPGLSAMFNGPQNLATDEEGNAYFIDSGNRKLRRVANDADHTVTTVGDFSKGDAADFVLGAVTAFKGNAYVVGSRASGGDIVIKATSSGQVTVLVDSQNAFDGYLASSAGLNAAANDGEVIYALGAVGRIWKVSTSGEVSSFIAGGGKNDSLSASNFDFSKPFPAKEAPMYRQNPYSDTMVLWGTSLLVPSLAGSAGYFLYKFSCQ